MISRDSKTGVGRTIDPAIWAGGPQSEEARALWLELTDRLRKWQRNWESLITVPKTSFRSAHVLAETTDNTTIFRAFAIAAISGNARWDRIAAVLEDLVEPFQDFSPARFAVLSDRDLDHDIVPWFRARRAGSARLRNVLGRLRETACILAGDTEGNAWKLLEKVHVQARGSPEEMALLLGTGSKFKLPGFGIALAAEALRLLGYDVCKPDRHVTRAIGAWGVVHFRTWPTGDFSAPQARPAELLATMLAVRALATANTVGVSYATSAIWLAGSVSGSRLKNDEFRQMVKNDRRARTH